MNKTTSALSPDKRELLKQELVDYFSAEHDINIGIIAAEEILDFLLKKINTEIYNQAIEDSQKIIRQGVENLIVNVDSLTKTE
jgi:uncharacterized protein (DUF2164 family)